MQERQQTGLCAQAGVICACGKEDCGSDSLQTVHCTSNADETPFTRLAIAKN